MKEYKFNDAEKSISIYKTDLPGPWINYLSNGHLNAFVSQAGGGFVWLENASRFRITRYRMHNLPIDSPGFYVYIKDEEGTVWSPTFRPVECQLDTFEAKHCAGKTIFSARKNDLEANLTLFIMPDYDVMTWRLDIINHSQKSKIIDVFAYTELSQHMWRAEAATGYYWRHMLKTWFDKESQTVQYLYHFFDSHLEKTPLTYFGSDKELVSYSGDRDAFIGNYRTEQNPIAVERGMCGNEEIHSGEPCAALHVQLCVDSNASDCATFFLGTEQGGLIHIDDVEKRVRTNMGFLRCKQNVLEQEMKLEEWWDSFLTKCECKIPDKNAERQINIWGPIDSVNTARYSRSVNVNAPGIRTMGFRDTCQDMLSITYRLPEMAKERFLFLLTKQYKAGNAIHCLAQTEKDLPDFATRSDDHLWLAFLAYSLVAETGDTSFLNEIVPFLAEDHINPGEKATAWDHLMAAMRFTETHLGSHGLPLALKGDWNDIIGKFSREGRGESVFAAQQYVVALNYMIEIAKHIEDLESLKYLEKCKEKQIKSIMDNAWNGKWWYRCFDDGMTPVGSENDEFGKIWLNTQSWAVMSGTGTQEQNRQAMDAVRRMLDTDVGLMLLTPGFETWPYVIDPFNGYNPGNGENGAVFCHAHTWAIIAEAMLGNSKLAWKYYNDLVLHNAIKKLGIERYKSEPYSWCSNIVGYPNNKQGWGNVSHISGTVTWMNVAATQYLLGVRPVLDGILFSPCIPEDWEKYEVKREYRSINLHISVHNPDHKATGVTNLVVNGKCIQGNYLPYEEIKHLSKATIDVWM